MANQPKDDIIVVEPEEVRQPTLTDTFSPDRVEAFIMGEATLGQLYGITIEEAYSVAELGYTLFEQGRIREAQTVFQGLIISNPYDGYFHNVLGAIYQKQGLTDGALEEYSISIALDPANVEGFVNRGELLMSKGNFEQAAADFKKAIELDPDATNRSVNRARALASVTAAALGASLGQQRKT